MTISLLHQCGHNSNWNISSFAGSQVGDGLILSPVHMARHVAESLDEGIRAASLFDPQYYLPSSQKKKLHTYEFFPENIAGGFHTDDFSMHALESAQQCLEFQLAQDFRGIVIPTRYFDQMITNFCDLQNVYTVHPFAEMIEQVRAGKPVYLTLVLTSHMIKDHGFRTNILNWVTSFQFIDGIYLIPDAARTTKQVDDVDFLAELLVMLRELREIGLEVVLGYQNTEGLLMTLVPGVELTFGSFENTRMFSLDKFIESDEERRGPKARIYLPGLLNWIQLGDAKEIRKEAADVWDQIYIPTDDSERVLSGTVEPYFNQPQLYMHHFAVYEQQIRQLEGLGPIERYERVRERISAAQEAYDELAKRRIELERHGRGDFIHAWLQAIDRHWRHYLV